MSSQSFWRRLYGEFILLKFFIFYFILFFYIKVIETFLLIKVIETFFAGFTEHNFQMFQSFLFILARYYVESLELPQRFRPDCMMR